MSMLSENAEAMALSVNEGGRSQFVLMQCMCEIVEVSSCYGAVMKRATVLPGKESMDGLKPYGCCSLIWATSDHFWHYW